MSRIPKCDKFGCTRLAKKEDLRSNRVFFWCKDHITTNRQVLGHEFIPDDNQWLFEGQGFYGHVKMEVFMHDNNWAWEFSQWVKDDPVFAGSFEPTANNRRSFKDLNDALFDAARYLERWFAIDHDEMNRVMAQEEEMMLAEMRREEWEVMANA